MAQVCAIAQCTLSCVGIWLKYALSCAIYAIVRRNNCPSMRYHAQSTLSCVGISCTIYAIVNRNMAQVCAIVRNLRYRAQEYGPSMRYRAQSTLSCVGIWPKSALSCAIYAIMCRNKAHVCAILRRNMAQVCTIVRNLRYRVW
jgi:hypothetical protein